MFGLSLSHLLVLLVIVALVFGTKRLRNLGGDVGEAIKSFRTAMGDPDNKKSNEPPKLPESEGQTIEGTVERSKQKDSQ